MKYDHMVKINGKYYSSGEDVPGEFSSAENRIGEKEEPAQSGRQQKEFEYTKTDIKRMSTSELQNLAYKYGVENAGEKSGGELKELLIERFSL